MLCPIMLTALFEELLDAVLADDLDTIPSVTLSHSTGLQEPSMLTNSSYEESPRAVDMCKTNTDCLDEELRECLRNIVTSIQDQTAFLTSSTSIASPELDIRQFLEKLTVTVCTIAPDIGLLPKSTTSEAIYAPACQKMNQEVVLLVLVELVEHVSKLGSVLTTTDLCLDILNGLMKVVSNCVMVEDFVEGTCLSTQNRHEQDSDSVHRPDNVLGGRDLCHAHSMQAIYHDTKEQDTAESSSSMAFELGSSQSSVGSDDLELRNLREMHKLSRKLKDKRLKRASNARAALMQIRADFQCHEIPKWPSSDPGFLMPHDPSTYLSRQATSQTQAHEFVDTIDTQTSEPVRQLPTGDEIIGQKTRQESPMVLSEIVALDQEAMEHDLRLCETNIKFQRLVAENGKLRAPFKKLKVTKRAVFESGRDESLVGQQTCDSDYSDGYKDSEALKVLRTPFKKHILRSKSPTEVHIDRRTDTDDYHDHALLLEREQGQEYSTEPMGYGGRSVSTSAQSSTKRIYLPPLIPNDHDKPDAVRHRSRSPSPLRSVSARARSKFKLPSITSEPRKDVEAKKEENPLGIASDGWETAKGLKINLLRDATMAAEWNVPRPVVPASQALLDSTAPSTILNNQGRCVDLEEASGLRQLVDRQLILQRGISTLREDIKVVESALRIEDKGEENKLCRLTEKWKSVAQDAFVELHRIYCANASQHNPWHNSAEIHGNCVSGHAEFMHDNNAVYTTAEDQRSESVESSASSCSVMSLLQRIGISHDLIGWDPTTLQWQ